jgi:Uma2 family endonuclease
MSAVLKEENSPVMAPHWKLSTSEYHRMIAVGILQEDDRIELIEGELIDMAPIGFQHSGLTNSLIELLGYPTRGLAIASVQNPIGIGSRSEPQPDFALLKPHPDRYISRLPRAEDTLLIVEIADASLRYDREVKGPLYARAGIPEYWIVNIPERTIEVHRLPDQQSGRYKDIHIASAGSVAPSAFPDVVINLSELLGQ